MERPMRPEFSVWAGARYGDNGRLLALLIPFI